MWIARRGGISYLKNMQVDPAKTLRSDAAVKSYKVRNFLGAEEKLHLSM